jgi:hypothetical protein
LTTPNPRPDGPVTVVAVMGVSFCGSTLLNLMLDSHPAIYGAGEIRTLVHPEDGAHVCTHCGEDCPVWSPEQRSRITPHDFYRSVAEASRKRVIVDTSKSAQWFAQSTRFGSDVDIRFVPVLVIKHPVRHLASLLVNANRPIPTDMAAWRNLVRLQLTGRLIPETNGLLEAVPALFGVPIPLVLRYEGFVRDPRHELAPLLQTLGLEYDPRVEACYGDVHHHIGGNSGASYQYHRKDEAIEEVGNIRKDFYKSLRGIQMDDKYRRLFDAAQLEWLATDPIVAGASRALGYEPLPD